jgi:aminoglycoside phosphotransferase family enzyme
VKLSFLDFSTLAQRKYYVEEELRLNQRLTHDIYLQTLPISELEKRYTIGGEAGEVVDYALEMKRLDNSREMDILLAEGKVDVRDMDSVAEVLRNFHLNTSILRGKLTAELLYEDFADIAQIKDFCAENIGTEAAEQLMNSIASAKRFLNIKSELILSRDAEGFTRDCHGDLHSGNIFLLDEPVLFDCIEFNEHFRQIDILNELAFFTMDLEFAGRQDLSNHFMQAYRSGWDIIRNESEAELYLFYKLYRANVRVKVNAIKTMQSDNPETRHHRLALFEDYFQLFCSYHQQFSDLKV